MTVDVIIGLDIEAAGPDSLLALQMQVARRADTLKQQSGPRAGLDLQCWSRAEAEVFGGDNVDALAEAET